MKNAILFQVNSIIAYLTVHLTFGFTIAKFLLKVQGNVNDFFDYDWKNAVDQHINSNRK